MERAVMTILQEASTKALDALRKAMQGNLDFDVALEAFEALRTALAQQGERKNCPQPEICGSKECEFCRDTAAPAPQAAPVAWVWNPASIEWEKVRAFGHWQQGALYAFGPTQPEPLATPAPQAQEPIAKLFGTLPVYDTPAPQAQDKSDNYLSGYCTGRTDLLKEQSAQPAQGVPEVGFGNMQSAQPVAQPLPDPCHTCAHYQQGKLPGVRIHDETCYECRSYWGNKWEAA